MKKLNVVVAWILMCSMLTPAMAQSRKDKKAAKKVAWEMQQQQQQEEAALRHQMRMDSLRAVQAAQEEAKAKERRKEQEREAEEAYQKSTQTYELPCWKPDTKEYFTAQVQRTMPASYVTTQSTALLRLAQQQMRQKIKGAYKQVVRDYMDQMDVDDKFTAASHIESAGEMIIDQYINDTEESCREMTRPDSQGKVTLYIGIEVSKEEIAEAIVTNIPKKVKEEVRFNEETFREKTKDGFANAQQE